MGFTTDRVTVDGNATLVFDGGVNKNGFPATNILLKNLGAVVLYVGEDNTVTTSTGFPVAAGELMAVAALGPRDVVYGITTGAAAEVAVIEQTP